MLRSMLTVDPVDDALAGTFPASDPPGWSPGIARLAPEIYRPPEERGRSMDSERTLLQEMVSLIGAVGLALLVPLAILALGMPIALGVRAAIAVAAWFEAVIR